jgi:hypothetical protein
LKCLKSFVIILSHSIHTISIRIKFCLDKIIYLFNGWINFNDNTIKAEIKFIIPIKNTELFIVMGKTSIISNIPIDMDIYSHIYRLVEILDKYGPGIETIPYINLTNDLENDSIRNLDLSKFKKLTTIQFSNSGFFEYRNLANLFIMLSTNNFFKVSSYNSDKKNIDGIALSNKLIKKINKYIDVPKVAPYEIDLPIDIISYHKYGEILKLFPGVKSIGLFITKIDNIFWQIAIQKLLTIATTINKIYLYTNSLVSSESIESLSQGKKQLVFEIRYISK